MLESSDINETKSISANAKLVIIGLGLVILFLLVFIFLGVQPESQSPQAKQAGNSTSSTINGITLDKVTAESNPNNPVIQINTDLGNLKIELYPEYAPIAVEKLIKLISEKYYGQGTVLESKHGIGFVIAKISGDVQSFVVADNEVNNLRSGRGSVAILKHDVSPAYLNNIFVGYKSQLELQEKYIILGQVLEGIDDIEKNAYGKTGSVSSMSVNERQVSSSW